MISKSFVKHGIVYVRCTPSNVVDAVRATLKVLADKGERRVVALAAAGMIVRMQAELAGDTIANTIELMREFMKILPGAPPAVDEPAFVLRAQDKLAPTIVRAWAFAAAGEGVDTEKVADAYSIADEMDRWQKDNGCKVPD